jgi:hypothetical protein
VALRAGPYTFDDVAYDGPSDVLYATVGAGPQAEEGDSQPLGSVERRRTPEEDVLKLDEAGRLFELIVVEPRARLDRDGAVFVSLPTGEKVRLQGIESEVG